MTDDEHGHFDPTTTTVHIYQSLPSPGATVCLIDFKEFEVDMGELRRVMTAAGTNMAEIVRHPDGRLEVVKSEE